MTYRGQYPELWAVWTGAGGDENNFAAFVVGQKAAKGETITDEEITLVTERAHSAINELELLARRPKV